jgi:hypothetical protein
MKFSTFMIIASILGLIFGLGFILFPVQLMASYGVTLSDGGLWVSRYLGSAFIGIGLVAFLARNAGHSETLGAIVLGNFVLSLTGLVVAFLDSLLGTGNALTWLNVVIYLFLSLGFGYFQFIQPVRS